MELYCETNMIYHNEDAAKAKDAWKWLLFSSKQTQVGLAMIHRKDKDGKAKGKDFISLVLPSDAQMPSGKQLEDHENIRKRVAIPCNSPVEMTEQMGKGYPFDELCQENDPAAEDKFQEAFENRLNQLRTFHGIAAKVIVPRASENSASAPIAGQLATELAHLACYGYVASLENESDTAPVSKLLKKVKGSHKQMLYVRSELTPTMTGKEFADAIYCDNQALLIRRTNNVDHADYTKLGGRDWLSLLSPSKLGSDNTFGLRHTWRDSKKNLYKDRYAIVRPVTAELSKAEEAKQRELRSKLLAFCNDPTRLDELISKGPGEVQKLPKPINKEESETGQCRLPKDWGTEFRAKVGRRWNAYRKAHGLEPLKFVGIAKKEDDVRTEATQAAWEMVKNACDQKEDKKRDDKHILFSSSFTSTEGVPGEYFLDAIYCGIDTNIKLRKGLKVDEKFKNDEWEKLLISSGSGTVAVDLLRGYVAIVLPKDAKVPSQTESAKYESLRKQISLQCVFPPAMTKQLEEAEKDADAYCHVYPDKEEATFQEEFEKRLNQYRKFHSQPEIKVARSGNKTPLSGDITQAAADLASVACYGFKIQPNKNYDIVDVDALKVLERTKQSRQQVLYTRPYSGKKMSGKQFADALYCNEKSFHIRTSNKDVTVVSGRDWLLLIRPSKSENEALIGLRRSWRKRKEAQKDKEGKELPYGENYALDIPSDVTEFDVSVEKQHESIRNFLSSFCGKNSAIAQLDDALLHPEKHALVIKQSTEKCALTDDLGNTFRNEVRQAWNDIRAVHGLKPVDVIGIDKSKDNVRNKETEMAVKLVKDACEGTEDKNQDTKAHLLYTSEEEAWNGKNLLPVPGNYLVNAIYCGDYQIVKRHKGKNGGESKEDDWQALLSPQLNKVAVDIIRQTDKSGKITDFMSIILPSGLKPASSADVTEFAQLRKHVVMQCITPFALHSQLDALKKDKSAYCHLYSDESEATFQKQFGERVNQYRKLHGQEAIKLAEPEKASSSSASINQRVVNMAVMSCAGQIIFPDTKYDMMKVEALNVVERTSTSHRQLLFRQQENEPMLTGKQLADSVYCGAKTILKALEDKEGFAYYRITRLDTWASLLQPAADPNDNVYALRRSWNSKKGDKDGKPLRRNYYAMVQPRQLTFNEYAFKQHEEIREKLLEACSKSDTAKIDDILKNPEKHTLTIKQGSAKCQLTPDRGSDIRKQAENRWNQLRAAHGLMAVKVVGIDETRQSVRNDATATAWQIVKSSCEQTERSKALAHNELLFVVEEYDETESGRGEPPYGELLVNAMYCGNSERFKKRVGSKDEEIKPEDWINLMLMSDDNVALDIVYEKREGRKYLDHIAVVLPKDCMLPEEARLADHAKLRADLTNACQVPALMTKQLALVKEDKNAVCHDYADKEDAAFRTQFETRLNEYRKMHGQQPISVVGPKSETSESKDMFTLANNLAHSACFDYRLRDSSKKGQANYEASRLYSRYTDSHYFMSFKKENVAQSAAALTGKQFMDAIYCQENGLLFDQYQIYYEALKNNNWQTLILASKEKHSNMIGLHRSWFALPKKALQGISAIRNEYYAVTLARPYWGAWKRAYVADQHERIRGAITEFCGKPAAAQKLDDLLAHPERDGFSVVKEDTDTCVNPDDFGTSFRSDLEYAWNKYRKLHDLPQIKVVGIGRFDNIVRTEETKIAWELVKNSCEKKDAVKQDANGIVFRFDYANMKKNSDETADELLSAIYCASEEQPLMSVQGLKADKIKDDDWLKLLFTSTQDSVAVDIIKHKSGEKIHHVSVSFVLPKDWKPPASTQLANFSEMRKNLRKMCFLSFPMPRVVATAKGGADAYCHEYSDTEEATFQVEFEMRLNQFRKAHGQADVKIERRPNNAATGKVNDIVQVTDHMALLSCYGYVLKRDDIQHTNAGKRLNGIVGTHSPIIYERSYTQPKLSGTEVADAIYCSNKAFSDRRANGAAYDLKSSHWQRFLQPVEPNAGSVTLRRTWIIRKPPSEEKSRSVLHRETYAFMVPKSPALDDKTAAYNEAVHEKLAPLCGKPQVEKLDKMLDELAKNPLKFDAAELKKAEKKVDGEKDQADKEGGLEGLSDENRKKASKETFAALRRKLTACQDDVERIFYTSKNVEPKEANAVVKAGMDRIFNCDSTERLKAKFWDALASVVPTFGSSEQESDGVEILPENGLDATANSEPKKDAKPKVYAKASKMESRWIVDCMLRRIPEIPSVNEQEFYKYYGKKDEATIREVEALIVGIRCSTGEVSVDGNDAYAELKKFGNTWYKAMKEMFDGWKAYRECFVEEASRGHVTISILAGCSKDTEFYEATMAKCQNAVDPNSKFHIKFPPTVAELEALASKSAFKRRLRNAVCTAFRASGRVIGKTAHVTGAIVGGTIKGVIFLFVAILHFFVIFAIPATMGAFAGTAAGPIGMAIGAVIMIWLFLPALLPIFFNSFADFDVVRVR